MDTQESTLQGQPVMPVLALRGAEPNYRDIYQYLRAEWRRRTGRSYQHLAEELATSKQLVTQWATGSGRASQPPKWVLLWLCWQLGLLLVEAPNGVRLARDNANPHGQVPEVPEEPEASGGGDACDTCGESPCECPTGEATP